MTEACEVVTIHTPNGPVRINKADYDPAKHTAVIAGVGVAPPVAPAGASAPAAASVTPPPTNPNPAPVSTPTLGVIKANGKSYVVDTATKTIATVPGIDQAGYADDAAAWAAIMAVSGNAQKA